MPGKAQEAGHVERWQDTWTNFRGSAEGLRPQSMDEDARVEMAVVFA